MDEINKASLNAAMQNGVGLTRACHGLNLDIIETSEYIKDNPDFMMELNESGASGYRQILSATNDAAAKKNMPTWMSLKELLDTFISSVTLWGQDKPEEYTIEVIVEVLIKNKVKQEGLTSLGLPEIDYYKFIEKYPNELIFLVKNNLA